MALWVSLPLTAMERQWMETLGGPWRPSRDMLWRRSGAEVALVTFEVWQHWQLPEPKAPIVTLEISDLTVTEAPLSQGAIWERPMGRQPWGVDAGLLRFPSGLLIEVILADLKEKYSE